MTPRLFFSWKALFVGAVLLSSVVLALIAKSSPACALGVVNPIPCDRQIYDAMEGKAWLEAQRYFSQTQNFISKPDSVLEYTCFRDMLNAVARNHNNARPFSETTYWSLDTDQNLIYLDLALQNAVQTSVTSYLAANFSHDSLGDRGTVGNSSLAVLDGGAYACDVMQRVWNDARCMNFFAHSQDRFHDFRYYQGNDPRREPFGLVCPSPLYPFWSMGREIAFNSSNFYEINPENPLDAAPYQNDFMSSYLTLMNPQAIAPAANCAPGIPTGIIVERAGFSPASYEEHVCPNPGCYYVPSGATTGDCQP